MPVQYPLASSPWNDAERQAMLRVMDRDQYTMGAEVAAYEQAFAQFVGARYAVMVNSGSSANLLMIAALCYMTDRLPLQPGDEVIVPAVSWPTTYYPVSQYGLTLVFVDVSLETLNMDPDVLAQAISAKTKAVLAVNLLGNPNAMEVLAQFCAENNLLLLEDNCESLGAVYQGKQAGTWGLMGTYSSFFSHHISTMEGGMVVTDDEELYHILLCMRSHGWTRHLPQQNRVSGTKSTDPFEESFKFMLPGYNVRPGELHGAVGQEQLKKLPDMLTARRANARLFQQVMGEHPDLLLQQELGESSWFGFSLVLRPGQTRWPNRHSVVAQLAAAGIECRPIVAGNFAKNPVVQRHLAHRIASTGLPNADWIDKNGLFVGNHHYDLTDAITWLAQTLH